MNKAAMVAIQRAERARDVRKRAIQDGRPDMTVAKAMRAEVMALVEAIGVVESNSLVGVKP